MADKAPTAMCSGVDGLQQRRVTEGIAPINRLGALARLFMAVAEFAEGLNLRYAKLGNPCFYDNADFPWVAEIESEWRLIRQELDRVLPRTNELPNIREITLDAASITRDSGWKVFCWSPTASNRNPTSSCAPRRGELLKKYRD